MRLGVVFEGGSREQKEHFMSSFFAFFKICLVLHWTHGMTLQFSLHENKYLVCIFPHWNLFWKKNKCLFNGNRGWRGLSETMIIEKVWVSPEKAAVSSGRLGTDTSCGRKGTRCWMCFKLWTRQESVNTQRIWKVAFFSYLDWSAWLTVCCKIRIAKGSDLNVSMNLARQLPCFSGWFPGMKFPLCEILNIFLS